VSEKPLTKMRRTESVSSLLTNLDQSQQCCDKCHLKGFSPRNLKYMRAFAEAWPDAEFVQQAAAQLPWGHNLMLLDKLHDPETRRWYAAQAIEHNWSRNILVVQIETRLLERSGKAVSNFDSQLPKPQSDLAREDRRTAAT